MDCLKHASGAYKQMKKRFVDVYQTLETNENTKNVNKDFEAYYREVIVIGFNFAPYDLNLIKHTPTQQLLDKNVLVIKKVNNYLCIKTIKLRFMNIQHFLVSGFSYHKLLKQVKVLITS